MSAPKKTTGSKIPIKKIVVVGLVLIATILVNSMAKMEGFSPRLTAWATILSFIVFSWAGYKLAWEHKHVGGAHGHDAHGTPWWKLGLAVLVMVYLVLQVWWFAESHWGRSADKIKEARVEERKRLERLVDAVDKETGLFTGKRYTRIAPIVNPASVPRHETTSVPTGFSDPIPIPPYAKWKSDTEGNTGPYLLWDGSKIWLCEEGRDHQIKNARWLAFASVTNYPLRMVVIVTPQPYTY